MCGRENTPVVVSLLFIQQFHDRGMSESIKNNSLEVSSESKTLREYAALSKWYGLMYPGVFYGSSDVNKIRQVLRMHFGSKKPSDLVILDCACGIGCPSIGLSKFGYYVRATDGSQAMLSRAKVNALREGANIEFAPPTLWRELLERFGEATFDCVICTGNSIYHQPPVSDGILLALQNMYDILRVGGICIVDTKIYNERKEELWFDRNSRRLKLRRKRIYGPHRTPRGTV